MFEIIYSNLLINFYSFAKSNTIIVSEKRLKVENSQDELILLPIKDKKYFIVTPFPKQSITRALTFILQKVRDRIEKQENIEIEAFLLPNLSSVVSVIPYNDEVYFKLNDPKSYESQALPVINFIAVGHINAFVLKAMDSNINYSQQLKSYLAVNNKNISKIAGVSNFLNKNKIEAKNFQSEINAIDVQNQPSTSGYISRRLTM